jgi:chemotaxis protein MotB
MSARGRRRGRGGHAGGHNDERWLLTYSDMITLLMALFIIMWAISTVNDSKFDQLAKSLSDAFSGKIFQGDKSVVPGSAGTKTEVVPLAREPSKGASQATQSFDASVQAAQQAQDLQNLEALQRQVDDYAKSKGLSGKLQTSIDERGLVIRIIPDDLLFDTGEAVLKPGAREILDHIADILRGLKATNPVRVEGNTDNVPISTPEFPDNWALSTARAVTVLRVVLDDGFDPSRLSAAGYADQRPVASNATAAGRAQNRRVEIVVVRQSVAAAEAPAASSSGSAKPGAVPAISPIGEVVTP